MLLWPSMEEIVRNYLTTVVAASEDEKAAKEIQNIMMNKTLGYIPLTITGLNLAEPPCNRFRIAKMANFGDTPKLHYD